MAKLKNTTETPISADPLLGTVIIPEYRIVKYYEGFFCHYSYDLEKKINHKFLWLKWDTWQKVAGNALTTFIPDEWEALNIVDTIEVDV